MDKNLTIGSDTIKPSSSVKILGVIFQSDDLKWGKQINKSIAAANAMILPLRYVNNHVSRPQFRMAT